MGCDIHTALFKKEGNTNYKLDDVLSSYHPINDRNYGVFGFLANVRNYSGIPSIAEQREFPPGVLEQCYTPYVETNGEVYPTIFGLNPCDLHSLTWVSLNELLEFDYDQEVEDRRCTIPVNFPFGMYYAGGGTAEPGRGIKTTYREFLGQGYFKALADFETYKNLGDFILVMAFDN